MYSYIKQRFSECKVALLKTETSLLDTSVILVQGVQLKSGTYFNISNLFTKIYNMLYYTTDLNLQ